MNKILYSTISLVIFSLLMVTSCAEEKQQKAEELLEQAQKHFDEGSYEKTLNIIDTLRKKYPTAIEARKKALVLHSKASEKQVEKRLDAIIIELEEAEKKFSELNKTVSLHKEEGKATREELTSLTNARMHRDSVKTKFDTECETLKFIRNKRQEHKE